MHQWIFVHRYFYNVYSFCHNYESKMAIMSFHFTYSPDSSISSHTKWHLMTNYFANFTKNILKLHLGINLVMRMVLQLVFSFSKCFPKKLLMVMYISKVFLQKCRWQQHATHSTVLALATLGNMTHIGSFILVFQCPRYLMQVQCCLSHVTVTCGFVKNFANVHGPQEFASNG
jgi:hypothetical protein